MLDNIYLVSCVGGQDVEWRRDELRLDRNRLVALFLSCSERLLDSIDPCGSVAGELDISTELDRLRREAAGDGRNEDGLDVLGDGCRDGCKDRVLLTVQVV